MWNSRWGRDLPVKKTFVGNLVISLMFMIGKSTQICYLLNLCVLKCLLRQILFQLLGISRESSFRGCLDIGKLKRT